MKYSIIAGEALCYLVQSESHTDETYRVDLIEGECACRDWVCRHRKYAEQYHRPYRCKHISQLREIALNDIIEHIKTQNSAQ